MIEFIIVWLCFSVLAFGVSFAYWQRKYPYSAKSKFIDDLKFSLYLSLGGPISFIVIVLFTSDNGLLKYGFKFY